MTETVTKKEQLIEIASRLFFEQGYHVTGVKQIIDEAGIAKGTFYCHFKSKEELGLEWLNSRNKLWIDERNAFLEQYGDDPKEKLLGLFDLKAKYAEQCNYRGCAFINTLAESPQLGCPMRKAIQEIKKEYMDFICGLVDECLPQASKEDKCQRAGAIYLLAEGATLATQSFCKTGPIEIAKKQVSTILAQ